MPRPSAPPQGQSDRWERNRRHWDETLDAHNVKGEGKPVDFDRLVRLYDTADVRVALDHLEPLEGAWALDVGGGLALGAALLARRGARVVICDLSVERLRAAKALLAKAGLADRVALVVGKAEALPLADGAFAAVFTKSVLIHTRIEEAAAECARVLAPGGRGAFVEPLRRNPFVNAYRALFAPSIWRDITTYFGEDEVAAVERGMRRVDPNASFAREPMFFFGFFAGVFSFLVPIPAAYRAAEAVTQIVDRCVFALLPFTRKRAWFEVMKAKRG